MNADEKKEAARVKVIEDSYKLKVFKPGDAVNYPKPGDSVSVHYIGKTDDGATFDNTYKRGQPVFFVLGAGQVIKAWDEIIPLFSRGQRARITVPPELAYGERGYPPIIPPNHTTTYELELCTFTSMGNVERLHREKKLAEAAIYKALQDTTAYGNSAQRKKKGK